MTQQSNEAKTLVDVGFEVGLDAADAPDAYETARYKQDYVVGFVAGQSISACVRRASRMAGAAEAGELGARYSIPLDRLLVELEFSSELVEQVRCAYDEGIRRTSRPEKSG